MKRDRSLRRIEDEKIVRQNKQMEIDLLKREIESMQEEKHRLEAIIHQYQPHLDLLTQVNSIFFPDFIFQSISLRLSIEPTVFIPSMK